MKCGCKVDSDTNWNGPEPKPCNLRIVFCPLHESAEEMLDIIKDILTQLNALHFPLYRWLQRGVDIIAKAESK